ncbi:hypothetical protein COCNU_02G015270 [Cocos nucifera]|uniref:Uncharacterized protein n=1 Tax=Cocos nucifera TaxID=13894 RepID=A0A8K0I112_COCNU|nr:hypothetical protein COCNU_02G015270 [Cocos nucifera]
MQAMRYNTLQVSFLHLELRGVLVREEQRIPNTVYRSHMAYLCKACRLSTLQQPLDRDNMLDILRCTLMFQIE